MFFIGISLNYEWDKCKYIELYSGVYIYSVGGGEGKYSSYDSNGKEDSAGEEDCWHLGEEKDLVARLELGHFKL